MSRLYLGQRKSPLSREEQDALLCHAELLLDEQMEDMPDEFSTAMMRASADELIRREGHTAAVVIIQAMLDDIKEDAAKPGKIHIPAKEKP